MPARNRIKYAIKNIGWGAYGRMLRNPAIPPDVGSMLFVCLGNICRSPFAEKVAAKYAGGRSRARFFSSAGIRVPAPAQPPTDAILAANEFGIDLAYHMARPLSGEMVKSFDMVIAMDAYQYRHLRGVYGDSIRKLFLLPLFDKGPRNSHDLYSIYNIRDPYGKDLDTFRACYGRIIDCIGSLLQELKTDVS